MSKKKHPTPVPPPSATALVRYARLGMVVFIISNFVVGAVTAQGIFITVGLVAAIVAYLVFLRGPKPSK
jgi:hypothetical protein